MPSSASYLHDLLAQYGLESLADWLDEQIRAGVDPDGDEIVQLLRQRDEYKARFRAIEERRLAGLPAISEREVIDYETMARQMFRANGLPEGFYDQPDDFVRLLVNDVSPAELQQRVSDGYVRVANEDPAIRAAFRDWFGADGDAALAAVFLDPDTALPVLQRQVAAASLGGLGTNFGFRFTQAEATGAAQRLDPRVSAAQINSGLTRLAEVNPVFSETLSSRERGDDLQAGREGLAYAFETGDAERVRSRIRARLAETSGGARSASSQRGMIGTGSAR